MKGNLTTSLVQQHGAIGGPRPLAFAPVSVLILLGMLVTLLSPGLAHAQPAITQGVEGCQQLPSCIANAATCASDCGNLIDRGFQVFTTDTFSGNGRTCGTCHVPQNDYTISPANIAALSKSAHNLLLASTTNANADGGLESQTIVNTLAGFDIGETPFGTAADPNGPFRTTMQIAGLTFTTGNLCPNSGIIASISGNGTTATVTMTEPMELFGNATEAVFIKGEPVGPPTFNGRHLVTPISPTNDGSGVLSATQFTFPSAVSGPGVAGGTVVAVAPCPGAGTLGIAGIDDGNRNIELGWAGDGALLDSSAKTFPGQTANCIDPVEAFAANPTDLHLALESFSIGAIRKHSTTDRARVDGTDFVCPIPSDLSALATFQEYLGRRYELAECSSSTPSAICTGSKFNAAAFATGKNGTQTPFSPNVLTFNDTTAETGKAIFLDSRASCNLCHFNAGAQDTVGDIAAEPALGAFPATPPFSTVSPIPRTQINTAPPWAASTVYIPASASIAPPGEVAFIQWSVIQPTGDLNFFLALSCSGSPCKSGAIEPDWESEAPDLGDTTSPADGNITWLNLGIAAQRLNSPGRNFDTPTDVDVLNQFNGTLSLNGGSTFQPFLPTATAAGLTSLLTGVTLPLDPGNLIANGTTLTSGLGGSDNSFNIQSLIEAAKKGSFFHNGAIFTNIEDAVSFYFTNVFDASAGGALDVAAAPGGRGCASRTNCGAQSLQSLANTYTGGNTTRTLNTLGFFLRATSVVYSLADCERLLQDEITAIQDGFPTEVQELNCTTDLQDVARVINGAKVGLGSLGSPNQYNNVADQMEALELLLQTYTDFGNVPGLQQEIATIQSLRHSIATITPDVP